MFAGHYFHSIDSKNRLMVPARFRDVLARASDRSLYVTVDVFEGERFLAMHTTAAWADRVRHHEELAKKDASQALYVRKLAWDTEILRPDKQCRLMLTDRLIEGAGLGKEVVFVGQNDRIEVWDAARWKAMDERATRELSKLQAKTYGQP